MFYCISKISFQLPSGFFQHFQIHLNNYGKNEDIGTAAMNFAIANVESPGLYCGMQNLMEPE